ncbi:10975_t:CDS:2, partial [Dentiscutata erythropus]
MCKDLVLWALNTICLSPVISNQNNLKFYFCEPEYQQKETHALLVNYIVLNMARTNSNWSEIVNKLQQ